MLLASIALSFFSLVPAFSDQCPTNSAQVFGAIGTHCSQEPSCVIVGGTHVLEWRSQHPAKIIVVCVHGLGLCARAYKPLAQEFANAGVDGFGVNVRGFGPDRNQAERAKLDCLETVDDVSKLLAGIHEEHPDYRVFLVGESMGGALAIRVAAENPHLVDGLICSAPAWKLLKMRRTAVKGIFELLLLPGSNPGPAGRSVIRQATADPQLTEHWLTDPAHKLRLTFGEATSFLRFISKTDAYAKRVDQPVLIVQGLEDHLVSPKGVAKLFRDIPSSNKSFLIDGQGEHLLLEEGRFSQALLEKLLAWIKSGSLSTTAVKAIDVINDRSLSPEGEHLLSVLRRRATRQQ